MVGKYGDDILHKIRGAVSAQTYDLIDFDRGDKKYV